MTTPTYTMISVASVPTPAMAEFMEGVGTLADELRAEAGCLSTRYGVGSTGEHTGRAILYQSYADMAGLDAAFAHYRRSATYARLLDTDGVAVRLRNLVRNEEIALPNQSGEAPAYAVVARWSAEDLMLDEIRELLPLFERSGAMVMRYGTLMTGSDAGKRLLTVGYPSMQSIEATYDGLRDSAVYASCLARMDMDWRNIIRVLG